jgi:pilus assembly protein CpaB
MGRRTLLLVAAFLLAAIGTGALFVYVQGQATAQAEQVDVSQVLVPRDLIRAGTTISARTAFTEVAYPKGPADAAGLVTARDQVVGKIANRDLLPQVPVAQSQFGGAVNGTTTLALDPDKMAIMFEFEDPARLGEFLYAGAQVVVWLIPDAAGSVPRVVLSPATVITTGSKATIVDPAGGQARDTVSKASVTFQVTEDDARALLAAKERGELYLTLLGDKDNAPAPEPLTSQNS